MDQEEVGFQFRQYGLVSAPVVNAAGRLLGVITVDDVVDVIEEEAEEDILKLGGVQETGIFARRPWRTSLHRLPWLLVNLGTAILASSVIAHFEGDSIQRRRAGRADADRRLDGRQCRHADADRRGAGAGGQGADAGPTRPSVLRKEFGVGGLNGICS